MTCLERTVIDVVAKIQAQAHSSKGPVVNAAAEIEKIVADKGTRFLSASPAPKIASFPRKRESMRAMGPRFRGDDSADSHPLGRAEDPSEVTRRLRRHARSLVARTSGFEVRGSSAVVGKSRRPQNRSATRLFCTHVPLVAAATTSATNQASRNRNVILKIAG